MRANKRHITWSLCRFRFTPLRRLLNDHVAAVNHIHRQTASPKQRHADQRCSCCLRNQHVLRLAMPNDAAQIDVQPSHAAVRERPASVTCKRQLQRGHQVAREGKISVVTRVDYGLELLGRLTGARYFKLCRGSSLFHRDVSAQRVCRRISDSQSVKNGVWSLRQCP